MKRKPTRASLHELRDQLCSVMIAAQLLEDRLRSGRTLDPLRAHRCAAIAARGAQRMADKLDAIETLLDDEE